MSFKACIDILVHFDCFSTLFLRHQGLVKFRTSVYSRSLQNQKIVAEPVCIFKGEGMSPTAHRSKSSTIDIKSSTYETRSLFVAYDAEQYQIREACLFRLEVDANLLEVIEISVLVELFVGEQQFSAVQPEFKLKESSVLIVGKASRVSEYLPVSFDQFQGCSLKASLHSTVVQLKFDSIEDNKENITNIQQTPKFSDYLLSVTSGLQRHSLNKFYYFYKHLLQQQIDHLQSLLCNLSRFPRPQSSQALQPTGEIVLVTSLRLAQALQSLDSVGTHERNKMHTSISESLLVQFQGIKQLGLKIWYNCISLILEHSQRLCKQYLKQFKLGIRQGFKQFINAQELVHSPEMHRICTDDTKFSLHLSRGRKVCTHKNGSRVCTDSSLLNIRSPGYFPCQAKAPHLYQEHQSVNVAANKRFPRFSAKHVHIFVLVHGFQASARDMSDLSKLMASRFKHSEVFVSATNEGRTHHSIEILGQRLACQVLNYLEMRPYQADFSLSFVGHSMGGVIIRSALRHLQKFKQKLYAFVTLSTPHTGYLSNTSKLVGAGLWYLNSWEKCKSIEQLMLKDASELRQTFMYQLAIEAALKNFKHIVLFSSNQDGFVSLDSARVEKNSQMLKSSLKQDTPAQVLCEMIDGILPMEIEKLTRINVVFHIDETSFDRLVGRTAHVKFVNDLDFMRIAVDRLEQIMT